MSKTIASAPPIFALRDEISGVLVQSLAINTDMEIEGHDRAAEEVIMRLVEFLADEAKALGGGQ